ncbi:hypothetical protein [Streptomyces sp. OR43]|uniref:hypothetical protein n=1 Tax=Streptomyces sp. or43 TaxID=2478957 RepID=UPI0011CE2D41|nr:hypothetical protein [Streptomyces sp. or43]TXS40091.1 hypothetical protein EAO72_16865 [Streptomyces sp. or43]
MSRWDDLSAGAHQMLADLDELDLAELAASATAAVHRVRDLHRPVEYRGRTICAECSAYDGHDSCDSPPISHDQCATLRALNNLETT